MNRNHVFMLVLLVMSSLTYVAYGQNASNRWKVSVGMGLSASEAMNLGFAKGAQVSYTLKGFEFGLSMHHATSQTLSSTKRHALGFHLAGQNASIQVSQGSKDGRIKQCSANTSSINLFAGINLLKLFKVEGRHSVILGAVGGIGLSDSSFSISNSEGKTIDFRYGSMWSYGAKASYECMITERVGVGLSATYDVPQENFYGLANLIVRF